MTDKPDNLDEHWYNFLLVIPSWLKGCLIAILGVGIVGSLFYWYGIRSPEEIAEEKVFVEPEVTEVTEVTEEEEVTTETNLPVPSEGFSYVPFELGTGGYNLILPDTATIVDPEEGADFVTVDVGGNIFLTVQMIAEPLPVGEDCSAYTDARLTGFEYTDSFYRLVHPSGAEACVFNGEAFGSYLFEFNLVLGDYSYEFQTIALEGNTAPFIPDGFFAISYPDPDSPEPTQFIFADGFESGDTSHWSR